jgi:hypothetical protein
MDWQQKSSLFVELVWLGSLNIEALTNSRAGSFLPVTLEQLARERGVWFNDRTTSCMVKVADQAGNATAALLLRGTKEENNQCIIHIFGSEVTTASFAMYTFSLAVLVQALSLISFSSVADYGIYLYLRVSFLRLTNFRTLPQEISAWLRVYRRHHFNALPPHRTEDISSGAYPCYYRSHMPRFISCHP